MIPVPLDTPNPDPGYRNSGGIAPTSHKPRTLTLPLKGLLPQLWGYRPPYPVAVAKGKVRVSQRYEVLWAAKAGPYDKVKVEKLIT